MAVIDLIGQRFGRLLVVGRASNDRTGNAQWLCQCDCGRAIVRQSRSLRRGQTLSCGCRKVKGPFDISPEAEARRAQARERKRRARERKALVRKLVSMKW